MSDATNTTNLASLTGLAQRVPGLFDGILDCLYHKDVASLLQTCKAIYPACYRRIWSTLTFGYVEESGSSSFANKTEEDRNQPWYPAHDIERRVFHGSQSHIWNWELSDLGLEHTRTILLAPSVFKEYVSGARGMCDHIENVFLSDKLNLKRLIIMMEVESPRLNTKSNPCLFLILRDLRDYIKSRPPRSLSVEIQIEGLNVNLMSKYFCLSTVTEFTLSVDYGTWSYAVFILLHPIQAKAEELSTVLADMVNLRKFFWDASPYEFQRRPTLSQLSPQVEKLQAVFSSLSHLRSFIINGFIFHPLFFLRPPEGLTEFRVLSPMVDEWWAKFAEYPFPNVDSIFIHSRPKVNSWLEDLGEYNMTSSLALESVSVRGLRKFKIFGQGHIPVDLEDCIIRNNPQLDEDSLRHVWWRRGAVHALKCSQIADRRALAAAKALWTTIPTRPTSDGGSVVGTTELSEYLKSHAAQEYPRLFASDCYKSEPTTETETVWREIASSAALEFIIRAELCTRIISEQYMHKFPDAESASQLKSQFFLDSLEMLLKFSHEEMWGLTELGIRELGHKSLVRMQDQIKKAGLRWADTFAASLRKGEEIDIDATVREWTPKLVEMYEEEAKDDVPTPYAERRAPAHYKRIPLADLVSLFSGWPSK
ncbi:hypothetical protein TWF481_003196 [Arthrobotrys musiformis]|uniref:F-box domain-containing protein n=1 Tax=Arthrobotrys musiformis TaxID=47236 RepID=A0AAV9VRC9_9PEZI